MKVLNIIKNELKFIVKYIIVPTMLVVFVAMSFQASVAYQSATHYAEHQNSMINESREMKLTAENYVRYGALRGLRARPLAYKIVFMKTYTAKLNRDAVAIYK